jgi:ribosome maturation protein SDO1
MVRTNEAVVARMKKGGHSFEILVDCDKALTFRQGEIDSLEDVLATTDIYKDVKLGEHASETDIKEQFHTTDKKEVAAEIIRKGEVQLTTEHKKKIRDDKRKQIVHMIHRITIDPKSGFPHPASRIEMVMQEAKVKVDEFKSVETQVTGIISALTPFIPIRVESRELEIVIPSQYTGNAFNTLKKFGSVIKDEWLSSGSLKVVLDIPSGVQEDLEKSLHSLTKGEVELKILKKK